MMGHEVARYTLGHLEEKIGNMDRAMRHYIIAAKCGSDISIGYLAANNCRFLPVKMRLLISSVLSDPLVWILTQSSHKNNTTLKDTTKA
eukprot:scaffold92421_cov22-Cyclotella_meneghiniana.AAC.2